MKQDIRFRIALLKKRNDELEKGINRIGNAHLYGSYKARIRENVEQIDFLEKILRHFYNTKSTPMVVDKPVAAKRKGLPSDEWIEVEMVTDCRSLGLSAGDHALCRDISSRKDFMLSTMDHSKHQQFGFAYRGFFKYLDVEQLD